MTREMEIEKLIRLQGEIMPTCGKEEATRRILTALTARMAARRQLAFTFEDPMPQNSLPEISPQDLGRVYQALMVDPVMRKQSGSFYTPAEMARLVTACCLRPLAYEDQELLEPEQILALTVCDPAMGAGSFLLSALDFLTKTLKESIEFYGRLQRKEAGFSVRLRGSTYHLPWEEFMPWIRHLAAGCLYGVDLDPAAVELARWSLWLAVGYPGLELNKLSHRLKQGDALLGCPPGTLKKQTIADNDLQLVADQWCRQWADTPVNGQKFFHWQVEFSEIFNRDGFDAVIGNPPWETLQPSSKEFFSRYDPVYRSLGQLEARHRQECLLTTNPALREDWRKYRDSYTFLSRFFRPVYSYQGEGKPSTYKLFLELAYCLTRPKGRVGLLLPANLLSDRGAEPLRRLLLEKCRWQLFLAMANRNTPFAIAPGFKFGAVIFSKGGVTGSVRIAAAETATGWENPGGICLSLPEIKKFSPGQLAFVSTTSEQDLLLLDKIYADCSRMGDSDWGIVFTQGDFNMTSHSHLFPPLSWWQEKGFSPCPDGRWRNPEGEEALPLYEGRMIGQFDFSQKGWLSGKGRFARWEEIPFDNKRILPQYLVSEGNCRDLPLEQGRSPLMNISSAFNSRSAVAAYLRGFPCNHSLNPIRLAGKEGVAGHLALLGLLNSFCFDYALRQRLEGFNLSFFLLQELPLPAYKKAVNCSALIQAAACLSLNHPIFAPEWQQLSVRYPCWGNPDRFRQGANPKERLRLRCIIDALAGWLYGLDFNDMAWILRDCHHPSEYLRQKGFARRLPPRGFWRVDKEKPPHLRHTVLTLDAFRYVLDQGPGAALSWQLPQLLKEEHE